jgi:hypothetical protein
MATMKIAMKISDTTIENQVEEPTTFIFLLLAEPSFLHPTL